jgi:peptide/nickel transport system ATP-binding protein
MGLSLEARDLSFGFAPGRPILRRFNLVASPGERVGLVAPSGAGKTTLCRLLAGYLKPQAGQALFGGQPVLSYRGYCPVQMIWQHPERSVNPRLRIKEALLEGDGIDGRIIDGLGIERSWLDRFPGELSGGEIQRFCIARALGRRTEFLIADEITTMVDLITQSQIWSFLLQEVEERGLGLVAVTHSDSLMRLVATRVVELESLESEDEEI